MLFTKYDNKVTKITKNDLIKSIKESDVLDVSFMEPVDKSNVRIAKQELDKLTRNNHISLILVRHKK